MRAKAPLGRGADGQGLARRGKLPAGSHLPSSLTCRVAAWALERIKDDCEAVAARSDRAPSRVAAGRRLRAGRHDFADRESASPNRLLAGTERAGRVERSCRRSFVRAKIAAGLRVLRGRRRSPRAGGRGARQAGTAGAGGRCASGRIGRPAVPSLCRHAAYRWIGDLLIEHGHVRREAFEAGHAGLPPGSPWPQSATTWWARGVDLACRTRGT